MKPGARPPLNDAYFRRMSAIEFAVKFDDGVGAGLREADIVLVGVSRTSKTPLSIYLGYLGYKAANVPLVKGIEPPPELFTIDQSKVVGLTIDAQRLSEIRGERIRWMRGDRKYADLVEIYDELEYAQRIHRRLGCPVIEVSELSIEEISHRIIRVVTERREAATSGVKPKPPVPKWRWAVWYTALGAALVLFYGLFTPFWFGLRALAWLAEFRARAARGGRFPLPHGEHVRLRLRRAGGRRARAARRQGDRPRRDDADGRARSGRVHDHDRRLPRVHGRRGELPDGLERGGRRARRAARGDAPASASASSDDPLLVSVRSGAAVSMPGMMDTILNLGLERRRRGGARGAHRQPAVRATTRTGG